MPHTLMRPHTVTPPPGTGIAPIRSVIQQRCAQLQAAGASPAATNVLLFFGVRYTPLQLRQTSLPLSHTHSAGATTTRREAKDYHYGDELEEAVGGRAAASASTLHGVMPAFSRDALDTTVSCAACGVVYQIVVTRQTHTILCCRRRAPRFMCSIS